MHPHASAFRACANVLDQKQCAVIQKANGAPLCQLYPETWANVSPGCCDVQLAQKAWIFVHETSPGTVLQTRPPDKVSVDEAIQIGHVLGLELMPSLIVEQHALTDPKLVNQYVYDWVYEYAVLCENFIPNPRAW